MNYRIIFTLFSVLLAFTACKTKQPSAPLASQVVIPTDTVYLSKPDSFGQPLWVRPKGEYHSEDHKHFKLDNTRLFVSFDWKKQYLYGRAYLNMQPYFYPQNKVTLDAKGFDIHETSLTVNGKNIPIDRMEYDSLKLTLYFQEVQPEDELEVYIKYTAKPNELTVKGSSAIVSDKGLYFINPTGKEPNKPQQIWTQGETEASSCWFPTFDSPNVKTKQELYITVEDRFKTLSNGKLISQVRNADGSRTDYWKQDLPHAPYLFAMAIGEFAVIEEEWNGKKVGYMVEPEYAPYAKDIFGHTPEMMTFFSERFNYPYPWDKYYQVVVRDFVSGAMENTTASIFMENLQVDDRYLLDQNWDFIIAHELIHHWFGDLVTCESWSNLPLNESFANYGEYLWSEYKYGIDEAEVLKEKEWQTYLYEAQTKREPLIRYHYTDREDMFDSHSYSKGGVILHNLRKTIGDKAFFEGVNLYLKTNEYKDVEVDHLRLALEEVTGQDLHWYFDQWFMHRGHPELKVSHSNGTLTVKQTQNPAYTPIYRLPVKVAIWKNGKKQVKELVIDKAVQHFPNLYTDKPDVLIFDSDKILPAVIDYSKSTEELIQQVKYAENVLHRIKGLEDLTEELGKDSEVDSVFYQSLSDDSWKIREVALELLEDYQGSMQAVITQKVTSLVTDDPKSLVRATAINTLTTLNANMLPVAKQALNDSSYTVSAVALQAYLSMGGPDSEKICAQYEDVKDLNMVVVLGNYYSYFQVPGKIDWYEKHLNRLSGYERSYVFNLYGSYAMNQPEDIQDQAIAYLLNYAENSIDYKTRNSAYQAIVTIGAEDARMKKVKEAAKKEQHPNVVSTLQAIGLL
ncbi:M1 family metallopeptidase [Algivirga pacifica]|uniref:Aminopeptidase N n=1 Tax=Algivirga pacifica TaxID=1162670 RepID=A0ABP9D558_9BACT